MLYVKAWSMAEPLNTWRNAGDDAKLQAETRTLRDFYVILIDIVLKVVGGQ